MLELKKDKSNINPDDIQNPLISVISVNYNSKHEDVHKTILSIQNQSYFNLEYIVIDGASNNGSLEIIQSYSECINVLISEKDNGIYQAMNKGIQLAKGSWIIFMNMGDTFAEDANLLKRLAGGVLQNYKGIVYGNTIHENAQVRFVHHANSNINKNRIKGILSLNHQSILTHREVFQKIGMFNETQFKIMADCHWINRVYAGLGPNAFKYIPEIIAVYNEFGVSSRPENLALKHLEFRQLQQEFCSSIQNKFYLILQALDGLKSGVYHQLLNFPRLYKWYRKLKYINSSKISNLD